MLHDRVNEPVSHVLMRTVRSHEQTKLVLHHLYCRNRVAADYDEENVLLGSHVSQVERAVYVRDDAVHVVVSHEGRSSQARVVAVRVGARGHEEQVGS